MSEVKIISSEKMLPGEKTKPYRGPEGQLLLVDANAVREMFEKMFEHAFRTGVNCGRAYSTDEDMPIINPPVTDILLKYVVGWH